MIAALILTVLFGSCVLAVCTLDDANTNLFDQDES